ncbi:hypothetical protein L6303_06465 [archaeon]|nr:type I restriction enzyme HsdR N-terminal domain-containing protein [Nanoarchaeota archaeon]MCG2724360.1 hypothetical protein [archaeon]
MLDTKPERETIANFTKDDIGTTEENVKQKFMVPLLVLLGHKREDLEFEHATRRGRIDIFIKKNVPSECKVIIDTKAYYEDLNETKYIEQLKAYALDENSLVAILANGLEMRIYSLLRGVAFEQSLLYCIKREDIIKEDTWQILLNLLEISNLKNRKVPDYINERERAIRETLMKEEEMIHEFDSKVEGIHSDIESNEEKIETLQKEKNNLEKEISEKRNAIWEKLSLKRYSFKQNIATSPSEPQESSNQYSSDHRKMAKRVRLSDLVSNGLIKDRQILHLFYRQPISLEKAQIVADENKLKYLGDGKNYSTSELARTLLKKHKCITHNYNVQGPLYWQTEDGQTINELNEKIRLNRGDRE